MIAATVNSAGLERALEAAARDLGRSRPLLAKLGKSLEKELRQHFLQRDREGNHHGWPSKHFWNREIRANTALTSVTEDQATVTIASPAMAQKVYGGTIRAKRGRFLAIPATQEAYEAGSPREGGMHLFLVAESPRKGGMQGVFQPKGRFFLMGEDGLVHYWLKQSVTQAADPEALPDLDQVGYRLGVEAEAWVDERLRRSMG